MGRDQEDFAAMFQEGEALDDGSVTEDMAAGLNLEEAVEEQGEHAAGGMRESSAEEAMEGEDTPASAGAPEAAGMAESPPADASLDLEKEKQRLKSWEGRLKAREAELKTKEQAGPADATGATPDVETAVAVMETQPIDEVMATLAEDFGDDFVKALNRMIEARAAEIAGKVADEKVSAVAGNVDQLVASLTDDKARNHFEMIADAHPDFMEVAQSPEFQQWIESLGDKAEQAQAIVSGGTARQVIKLLSEFKAASQDRQAEPDAAMMAAQTVKGRGGMRLPAKPEVSDDYEAAWNSFS